MREVGTEIKAIDTLKSSPAIRHVFDRCLDAMDPLISEARNLPASLKNRRLAMESAAIIKIAERLIDVLRQNDPLGTRLKLHKLDYLWQCLRGAFPVFLGFSRI